jgi:hypothetical protein
MEDVQKKPRIAAGDVGRGLAWSYYYCYLNRILPSLQKRVEGTEFAKNDLFRKNFVCVMPCTGRCPPTFAAADEHIRSIGSIDHAEDVAGNKGRNYKTAVHEVTDPRDPKKKYIFMGEFATPLITMRAMTDGEIADFTDKQRVEQTEQFRETLTEVIDSTGIGKDIFLAYPMTRT